MAASVSLFAIPEPDDLQVLSQRWLPTILIIKIYKGGKGDGKEKKRLTFSNTGHS